MAEEAAKQEEAKPAEGGSGKKLPIKTIIILAAALLIEAAMFGAVYTIAGPSAEIEVIEPGEDPKALAEEPKEVLLVADKFANSQRGRTYLYDTEVYIVLRQKHEGLLKDRIEATRAKITTEIGNIFRKMEPAHLYEPELSTLTRQIKAMLKDQFGVDESGEPYVMEVLVKKATPYRADM